MYIKKKLKRNLAQNFETTNSDMPSNLKLTGLVSASSKTLAKSRKSAESESILESSVNIVFECESSADEED